jgi:hypothetical protein
MDKVLIFIGFNHYRELDRKKIIKDHPKIISQREELEKKSNWRELSMSLKKNNKVLHVNINSIISYNKFFEIIDKININKEKLGANFYIYLPVNLIEKYSKVIIRSASKEINVEVR